MHKRKDKWKENILKELRKKKHSKNDVRIKENL